MVIPTQVKSKRKEHDATITGQKLSLTITPVADAPTNMGGVSDSATLDNIQPGHKAAITVTLTGEFADVAGSEAHFLIVSAPQGVTVSKGAEIDLAIFEDFSFLESSAPSDTNASDASEPAPVAASPQESGHAEPAPVEPVEVDLINVPMPYDMDATQSIA